MRGDRPWFAVMHHLVNHDMSASDGRYTANKDPARRAPPDRALWRRVLNVMRLSSEQLEAFAEVWVLPP